MKKYKVKVYSAVVKEDDGEEMAVDIGVVDVGVPFEAYWDSWIDPRIYFNMSQSELDAVQIGDEIADATLMEIDKENPSILEAEYDEDAYSQSMEVF